MDDRVTTIANDVGKLHSVVVGVVVSLDHWQNNIGDIPQFSFPGAHTAHLGAVLVTLRHGHVTAGPSDGG